MNRTVTSLLLAAALWGCEKSASQTAAPPPAQGPATTATVHIKDV